MDKWRTAEEKIKKFFCSEMFGTDGINEPIKPSTEGFETFNY